MSEDQHSEIQHLRRLIQQQSITIREQATQIDYLMRLIADAQEKKATTAVRDDNGDPVPLDKIYSGDF